MVTNQSAKNDNLHVVFVPEQYDREEKPFMWCILFPIFLIYLFFFKSKNHTVWNSTIKSMICTQKNFLMIDDEREIVVILLQKSNHYSSYIVNHQKVLPYTDDTFYGADPYCILQLLVNCSVFSLLHRIICTPQKWHYMVFHGIIWWFDFGP